MKKIHVKYMAVYLKSSLVTLNLVERL